MAQEQPKKFIPFSPPMIGDEEIAEVVDSLRSGWITSGPKVARFEDAVKSYVGAKYAAASFSCTSSLFLCLKALGVKEGDEIIVPTLTFASTAHVVVHCGAKPVFVDVDPETFQMDVAAVESAITPNTKGVIPVHYAGNSVELDALQKVVQKYGLFLIEDAAHAIGTEFREKKIGAHGSDGVCFSFYATKNLATAEGGMTVTDREDLALKIKKLAMYGISDSREIWQSRYTQKGHWFYDVEMVGYKANMTDLNAALGIHQLAKLDRFNSTREDFAGIYKSEFAETGIQMMKVNPHVKCSWHLFPILLPKKIDRDRFIVELKERGIGTSVLFRPLHLHTAYQRLLHHKPGSFPVSESIFDRLVNLPISPAIGEENIRYIAGQVRALLETV